MAVSGKPAVTTVQVGANAYFMYNNLPRKAKVIKTVSEVTDANNDNTAEEVINYYCEGYSEPIKSTKVYASGSALATVIDDAITALDA